MKSPVNYGSSFFTGSACRLNILFNFFLVFLSLNRKQIVYHFFLFIFLTLFVVDSNAQYSLNKSYDNIEIRGNITPFYKFRLYPESDSLSLIKQHKNIMRLKDARIRLKGSSMKKFFEYELHLDFANLIDGTSNQPEVPILDGYVTLNHHIETTLGYTKIPFSRESMTPIIYSPFLKRSMIIDEGQSRRDVGLHLQKGMYSEKIKFYASYVNGLPEISKQQDDSLGNELITRIEVSWPSKMKYRGVDIANSPIPVFSFGTAYRYSHKGKNWDADDETIWTGIDGIKQSLTTDLAINYRGIQLLIERNHISYDYDDLYIGTPEIDAIIESNPFYTPPWPDYPFILPENQYTTGYLMQLTYYLKKYKSVFSFRYDQANINYSKNSEYQNFKKGKIEDNYTFAYNYRFNNHLSVFKIQIGKTLFSGTDIYGADLDYSKRPSMLEIRLGFQYVIG